MRKVSLYIAIAVIITIFTSCVNEKEKELSALAVGSTLPTFAIVMDDGLTVDNVSLNGSVSLIAFFRTTCPDCQQELPVLQRINDEFDNVRIILVSIGEGEPSITDYWRQNGLSLSYSVQNDMSVANLFGVSRIPQVYVCDRQTKVRFSHSDNPIATYEQLKTELTELLK